MPPVELRQDALRPRATRRVNPVSKTTFIRFVSKTSEGPCAVVSRRARPLEGVFEYEKGIYAD